MSSPINSSLIGDLLLSRKMELDLTWRTRV